MDITEQTPLEALAAKKAAEYANAIITGPAPYRDGAEAGYKDGYITAAREWVAEVHRLRTANKKLKAK